MRVDRGWDKECRKMIGRSGRLERTENVMLDS